MTDEKRIRLSADHILRRREERMTERKNSDIRASLQTPEGRRLYWRWMEEAGIWKEPFVKGFPDVTDYNLGRLSVGRDMLFALMQADPTALERLKREHASEIKRIEDEDKALAEQKEEDITNIAG